MNDLEETLSAALNNPQLMEQITAMAQNLSQESAPGLDPKLLQGLGSMMQQSSIDPDQQALLNALRPYLSQNRVHKLERAMRAAGLAGAATAFLGVGR